MQQSNKYSEVICSKWRWATEGDVEGKCKRQREGGGERWSCFQHHKCGQRHTGGQLLLLHAAGEAVRRAEDCRQPGKQPQPPDYFVTEYRNNRSRTARGTTNTKIGHENIKGKHKSIISSRMYFHTKRFNHVLIHMKSTILLNMLYIYTHTYTAPPHLNIYFFEAILLLVQGYYFYG